MSINIILVDPSEIKHGDTIICADGFERTVDKQYIKNSDFGICIHGHPYGMLKQKVKKVLFPVWHKGEIIRYE